MIWVCKCRLQKVGEVVSNGLWTVCGSCWCVSCGAGCGSGDCVDAGGSVRRHHWFDGFDGFVVFFFNLFVFVNFFFVFVNFFVVSFNFFVVSFGFVVGFGW